MQEKQKENIKIYAALLLLLAIFAGSFVVVWQIKEKNKPVTASSGAEELERQVAELNKKIDDLNKAIDSAKEQVTVESSVEVSRTTKQVAGASTSKEESSSSDVGGLINLNTASLSQLDSLDGIGPTYAQRIIDYREANGDFTSIDQIKNIKGIGDKKFEKIQDQITI